MKQISRKGKFGDVRRCRSKMEEGVGPMMEYAAKEALGWVKEESFDESFEEGRDD